MSLYCCLLFPNFTHFLHDIGHMSCCFVGALALAFAPVLTIVLALYLAHAHTFAHTHTLVLALNY